MSVIARQIRIAREQSIAYAGYASWILTFSNDFDKVIKTLNEYRRWQIVYNTLCDELLSQIVT